MGKHKKMPPPAPTPAPTVENNLDLSESAARKALRSLETALDQGDASPQTAREIGSLARALVTIEGERRAQQKAKQFTAKNLPREVLMECLRSMPDDELAHVQREIEAMRNTESVLG